MGAAEDDIKDVVSRKIRNKAAPPMDWADFVIGDNYDNKSNDADDCPPVKMGCNTCHCGVCTLMGCPEPEPAQTPLPSTTKCIPYFPGACN